MYKEGQKFLENWCNDTKNDGYEKDAKEYSEREVEDMLYDYRLKFSLCKVVKSLPSIDSIIVEPLTKYLKRTTNFTEDQSIEIAKNFYNYIDDYDIDLGI